MQSARTRTERRAGILATLLLGTALANAPEIHTLYQWTPIDGARVVVRFEGESTPALYTSQINNSGAFYLNRPEASVAAQHYSTAEAQKINAVGNKHCSSNTLKLQPSNFLAATLAPAIQIDGTNHPLNYVENTSANLTYSYRLVFSKGNVRYSGKALCTLQTKLGPREYVISANLTLKPGWNILAVKTELQGKKIRMTYLNKKPGTDATWVAFSQ